MSVVFTAKISKISRKNKIETNPIVQPFIIFVVKTDLALKLFVDMNNDFSKTKINRMRSVLLF